MMHIFLNQKEYLFSHENLPLLIHGEEHSGASLFTITVITQLFHQHYSFIVLCGYPMAQQEFERQTESHISNHFYLPDERNKFLNEVKSRSDSTIILLKNVELFDSNLINFISERKNTIISGNANAVPNLNNVAWNTTIQFSQYNFNPKIPLLNKYEGYLQSQSDSGLITVQE